MSTPMNPHEQQPNGGAVPPRADGWAPGGLQHAAPTFNGAPANAAMPATLGANSPAFAQARLPKPLGDDGKSTPIGFGRLVTVELRKMVDTRAGKWLLGIALAIMLIIAVGMSFTNGVKKHPEFGNFLATSIIALKYILPIIGVLAATSEWSQRTGLVTFALEPRRTRVGFAKWLAALILGAVVIVFVLAIAALMTIIVSALTGHAATWNFGPDRVGWFAMIFLLFVSMGVAFGLLIQNTPAAICAFLFIPIIYSIVTTFPSLQGFGEWTDPNQNLFSLLEDNDSQAKLDDEWPKILVGQFIWLVLPMAIGFIRLNKREVKSS